MAWILSCLVRNQAVVGEEGKKRMIEIEITKVMEAVMRKYNFHNANCNVFVFF